MGNGRAQRHQRWTGPLVGLVGLAVLTLLAFRFLNPIIAAFLVIVAATVLCMSVIARDWDSTRPTRNVRRPGPGSAR